MPFFLDKEQLLDFIVSNYDQNKLIMMITLEHTIYCFKIITKAIHRLTTLSYNKGEAINMCTPLSNTNKNYLESIFYMDFNTSIFFLFLSKCRVIYFFNDLFIIHNLLFVI